MKIGVLYEIKENENRVALLPAGAEVLAMRSIPLPVRALWKAPRRYGTPPN